MVRLPMLSALQDETRGSPCYKPWQPSLPPPSRAILTPIVPCMPEPGKAVMWGLLLVFP